MSLRETDVGLSGLGEAGRFAPSTLGRQIYQLAGAIVIALVIPYVARHVAYGGAYFWDQLHTSLYVLIGILLSHAMIQQLSRYPGEDPLSTVMPAVFTSFGCVIALIAMGRLDYSRSILAAGFAGTFVWYSLLMFLRGRILKPRLIFAQTDVSHDIKGLELLNWLRIEKPTDFRTLPRSDGLVIDLSSKLSPEWQGFAIACANSGLAVYDLAKTRELMRGEVEIEKISDIGLDNLLPARSYPAIKSFLDVLLALMLLAPITLLILIAAVFIKLDSRGPVFFIQKRVGYRGRVFDCYKLRSMRVDAPSSGPQYTLEGDPRITRVGRFIRKYRIDELPQVFNILKGQMSWIGPRPEAAELSKYYEQNITFYSFRHSVKPGITGWAAVRQGNVAEVDAAKTKLGHDFFYIKNLSPGLDAFILVKTVWIILTGFGSRSG